MPYNKRSITNLGDIHMTPGFAMPLCRFGVCGTWTRANGWYSTVGKASTIRSCWPYRETIVQETSMTERGVIRILKRLEKKRAVTG